VSNYLVRVHLPDRPGALGAVASRIGSVGGDVVSFEILERVGGQVVDEIGVALAGDGVVELLREEILEVDGVSVEMVRRVDGELPDRHAELLALATDLFGQPSRAALLDRLAERARASLLARFAAVVDPSGSPMPAGRGELPDRARFEDAARQAMAPGRVQAAMEDGLAAALLVQARLVLVVGRRQPVFRERERRWVSTMATIADHGWQDLS